MADILYPLEKEILMYHKYGHMVASIGGKVKYGIHVHDFQLKMSYVCRIMS